MSNVTGYELSRKWFDWCFENPEKVTPNHTALYFFAIEHCNRLGWKSKFGFPMEMAKNAIGIKNYRTYSKTFEDLVEWGFFEVHERSKNQWSANIIAIVKNTKATTKALDKAMQKHLQKHSQKQVHGTVGIDKQYIKPITNTEPITVDYVRPIDFLKKNEIEFEQLQMKANSSDFEECSEQWSLSVEGSDFQYSEDSHEDYRKLKARFQKWLNSWSANKSKPKIDKVEKIPDIVKQGKAQWVEVGGKMLIKPLGWKP